MSVLRPHLGDRCAALVDGQLGPEQEERAWQHVLVCPTCRATVEQQVAVKQALGSLRAVPAEPVGWPRLDAATAWCDVAPHGRGAGLAGRRRSALLGFAGVVGGGALTASLVAAVAVGAGTGAGPVVRPAPAQLTTPTGRAVPARPTGATSAPPAPGWTGGTEGSETGLAVRGDRSD